MWSITKGGYGGWVVARTLYVSARRVYLMRSVILSQWIERRMEVIWQDFGALTTVWAKEFWICGRRDNWDLEVSSRENCSNQSLVSVVVVCNSCICNVTHQGAAHGGPVVLRPGRATPCFRYDRTVRDWAIVRKLIFVHGRLLKQ